MKYIRPHPTPTLATAINTRSPQQLYGTGGEEGNGSIGSAHGQDQLIPVVRVDGARDAAATLRRGQHQPLQRCHEGMRIGAQYLDAA
mmetsp:Transcript_14287/g.24984  ORF Transcript_14287/g.24984 Transcript_14287/m.24984 type:complete len:87 (+) Transcript_14287:231-491(+)